MKSCRLLLCLILVLLFTAPTLILAQEERFDLFLRDFGYEMREEMKNDSKGLIPLLVSGTSVKAPSLKPWPSIQW